MSQQTLVNRLVGLGITTWHQTTVGKIEAGTRPVRLAEALAVAQVFGLSLDEFLIAERAGRDDRAHRARLLLARRDEIGHIESLLHARERQLDEWIGLLEADHDLPGEDLVMPTSVQIHDEAASAEGGDDADHAASAPADTPPREHRAET